MVLRWLLHKCLVFGGHLILWSRVFGAAAPAAANNAANSAASEESGSGAEEEDGDAELEVNRNPL